MKELSKKSSLLSKYWNLDMRNLFFTETNSIGNFLNKFFTVTSLLSLSVLSFQEEAFATDKTFFCGAENYRGEVVPTTYVIPETGGNPIALIYWVQDYFNGPPEERCSVATSKIEAYYSNNELEYIDTDIVNDLPVICVAQSASHRCTSSDVIVTLRPGTDRFQALNTMMNLIRQVDGDPLEITDDLLIYRDGEAYVNLEVFIEKAQGM